MAYLPDVAFDRSDELSHAGFRLYACLCKHRNNNRQNKFYGLSFPGRELISSETQIDMSYVSIQTQKLLDAGWIEKEGQKIRPIVGFEGELRESGWIPKPPKQKKCDNPTIASDKKVYQYSETPENTKHPEIRYQTEKLDNQTISASNGKWDENTKKCDGSTKKCDYPNTYKEVLNQNITKEKNTNSTSNGKPDELLAAMCWICKIDPQLLAGKQFAEMSEALGILKQAGKKADEIPILEAYWREVDWRGKGGPPRPKQIPEIWTAAIDWNKTKKLRRVAT